MEEEISESLSSWFLSSSAILPGVLVMDGGVSTHLENLIAPKKFSHRDLWSSSLLLTEDGRSSIVEGHRHWLNSGSDILTTVTYQCHFGLYKKDATKGSGQTHICNATDAHLVTGDVLTNNNSSSIMEILPEETMSEMMVNGVLLAKLAIDTNTTISSNRMNEQCSPSPTMGPFVVASTGPYGAAMADGSEYTGKYPAHVTREALVNFHTRKARILLSESKPDGLAIETIPNIEEVGVVCEVLRDLQQQHDESNACSRIACWISLACKDERYMNDGHTIVEALRLIRKYDPAGQWIAAVGINCFNSAYTSSLVTTMLNESTLQDGRRRGIIIYPNSGESWDAENEEWKDGSGTSDDELVDQLIAAVQLIRDVCESSDSSTNNSIPKIILGGCCRTSPATIAMLRKRVDEMLSKGNSSL